MSRHEDYAYEDEQGEHTGARLLREVLEVAILTLLFFGVVRLLVQNYRVDGPSMQRTLYTNEYILVDKATYYFHSPERGDVIVFQAPSNPSQLSIKRVIAVPGDTITLTATTVSVNNYTLNEPYISTLKGDSQNPVIVNQKLGDDQYYVMGDDRIPSAGSDSRSPTIGTIPRPYIVGKAVLVFWPLSAFHFISSYDEIFSKVPNP